MPILPIISVCYIFIVNSGSQFLLFTILLFIFNSPSNSSDVTPYQDSFMEVMDQIED